MHPSHFSSTVRLLVAFCVGIVLSAPLLGQTASGTISGQVVDPNGLAVVGASVSLREVAATTVRSTLSDGGGRFTFLLVGPRTYILRAKLKGFSTSEVRGLAVSAGERRSVEIRLRVGDVNETVVVTSSAISIDSASSSIATVLDRELVEGIPLNGRSFQTLAALAPGVTLTKSDATNQGQFSVNGQRADSNYFMVDGVGANVGVGSSYTLGGNSPAVNAVGSTASLASVDAVETLAIQTSSFAPEFGRSSGGQIRVSTRSGSDKINGSVYEYFRNDALNANDWFANSQALGKGPLRHNDFGGVVGGPVIRHRVYFFFSYEGLRLMQPSTLQAPVPGTAFRQSAPANMQVYLNAYPIPNTPNGPEVGIDGGTFAAIVSNPRVMDASSLRLDYRATSRVTVFGRYNRAPSYIGSRLGAGTSFKERRSTANTLTIGSTLIISNSVNDDLRVNFSRVNGDFITTMTAFGGAIVPPDSALFPQPYAAPGNAGFSFSIEGVPISVGRGGSRQSQFNLIDDLSITRGPHSIKLGVDYRSLTPTYDALPYNLAISTRDDPVFSSGRASSVTITSRLTNVYPHFQNLSAYVQDSWQRAQRLTFTYGVRWDLNPPPSEKNNNYPYSGTGDPTFAKDREAAFWKTRYTNFAPRFGVALSLRNSARVETVLRGGLGMFFDSSMGTASSALQPAAFPYSGRKILRNVALPLTDAQTMPPSLGVNPSFIESWSFDHDLRTPRTYEWSFGIQQALGPKQSISAYYVGNVGSHLISDQFAFQFSTLVLRSHYVDDTGSSAYNSLQLQFERRASNGLSGTVSYTFARSIDTSSNDSSYLPTVDRRQLLLDRAPSDFDVRHTLSIGLTYRIPRIFDRGYVSALTRNWSASIFAIARSAMPITYAVADDSTCFIDDGDCLARPDLVPEVPLYLYGSMYPGGKRLNPAAFRTPPAGRQGTLPRNFLRGFPAEQINLSLARTFRIGERWRLQFTADIFNVFNHPNFADPPAEYFGDPFFDQAEFGVATSMLGSVMGSTGSAGESGLNPVYQIGTPRSIQLSVRLKF